MIYFEILKQTLTEKSAVTPFHTAFITVWNDEEHWTRLLALQMSEMIFKVFEESKGKYEFFF